MIEPPPATCPDRGPPHFVTEEPGTVVIGFGLRQGYQLRLTELSNGAVHVTVRTPHGVNLLYAALKIGHPHKRRERE